MSHKMSTDKLKTFLKALDVVKQDYICGFCKEMCVKPAVLSVCFHMICSAHFESLKCCPTCDIPLLGSALHANPDLENGIESVKQLDKLFQDHRSISNEDTEVSSDGKAVKNTGSRKKSESGKKNKTKNLSKTDLVRRHSKTDVNTSLVSSTSKCKGVEKKNVKGETLLHVACRMGKLDKVLELLNTGANTNTKDNAGWTPLHEVVQNGHLDLVKVLLQFNTLINVPGPSNETPLHEAVRYGFEEIAEELVKNGADLDAKNCKGETPLELASEKMKTILLGAAEDVQQTQGVNITHIANLYTELDFEDIRVYSASSFRTVGNKIKILAKSHANLHSEGKFTKNVTHLIVDTEEDGTCTSSLDVLQGIAAGLWILSSEWVIKSSVDKLEEFEAYEVKGVGNTSYRGPRNSRYNKYKQLPGLFNGCHFYLHNFFTKYEISKTIVLTKAILSKLITDAGGVVLRRVPNPELIPDAEKLVPYHAKKGGKLEKCSHYIIFKDMYEPMYNMAHIKALPVGWLIECIEKYELCDP